MPEGHVLHRIAQDHTLRFEGELSVSSPQGRFADGACLLDRCVIERIEAYGKHLFYWWSGEQILHIHLGLYGKFRNYEMPAPAPRGQVRLRVTSETHGFDLNGPSACELLTSEQQQQIAARLGADPLRSDADVEKAWRRISRSRAAIGKLLLDQSVIAGVGNIFRAEALYSNRLAPERAGKTLSRSEFDDLWESLVEMLRNGVRYNRIITADPDQVGKPRSRMKKGERLLCYKQEYCGRCDSAIQSWELGSRTVYACTTCQSAED